MATAYQFPGGSGVSPAEERAILIVTCLAAFLFFNSFGSIGVAVPTIQKQFGNSLAEIQWIALMGVVTISSLSFCFGRAGAIGTTITVALMEIDGGRELWAQPAALAGAQQFAFACLVPVGLLALWIASKRPAVRSAPVSARAP